MDRPLEFRPPVQQSFRQPTLLTRLLELKRSSESRVKKTVSNEARLIWPLRGSNNDGHRDATEHDTYLSFRLCANDELATSVGVPQLGERHLIELLLLHTLALALGSSVLGLDPRLLPETSLDLAPERLGESN